jgi:c-di-GMP-binding flagellar brake protein YcgR
VKTVLERSTQIDARREPRFPVHWRAGLKLPDGRIIELRVKDISESGMGFVANEAVPPAATLEIRVRVPDPGNSAQTVDVAGTVKVAYVAMRGYEFAVGVTWAERTEADRALMSRWMRKMHLGF